VTEPKDGPHALPRMEFIEGRPQLPNPEGAAVVIQWTRGFPRPEVAAIPAAVIGHMFRRRDSGDLDHQAFGQQLQHASRHSANVLGRAPRRSPFMPPDDPLGESETSPQHIQGP